jgi:tRNA(Ile)-lysidine synthetase-like protein
MPRLEAALNPRLEEALAGAARVAAEEDALLDAQAKTALAAAAIAEGFSAGRLAGVHPVLLRRALLLAAQGTARPERLHLDRLADFLLERKEGRLDLPGGRAVIERGVLRFEAHGPPLPVPADVQVPGPGVYGWAGRALHVGSGAQRADLLLAPFPWTLRKRLPGDRFRLAGGPDRKLGDAFQTAGIPASRRDHIPLLADAAGRVFWVEGLPRGPACAAPPADAVRFEFGPEMDALR